MGNDSRNGEYESNHKRIAKNTIFLYFRQILIMIVSLYTSRVILNTLGIEDYGVYNVVGGFVAMFNMISGAFSVAITRFMAYVHGYGTLEDMRKCYSVALVIQIILGLFICILLATIGVWYVVHIMVLPKGRGGAALWVLFFSAISFLVSLISIPYNAMIVAHEHMQAFAYIGIAEAILRLSVAFLVRLSPWDKLIAYSLLMVISAFLVRLLYAAYCKKHFDECRFSIQFDSKLLKEMMAFVGWAFLGNGAVVLKNQGINMIMNLFGGTTVNAARGIALSINSAVQSFTNNYIQAIQPQITQLYASGNQEQMRNLIYRSCRYAFYLMLILCLPMIKNMEYVLQLWLGQVPKYVVGFATFTLLESLVQSLNNPMLYGVLATGHIKTYEIILSTIYVLSLPFSYIALKLHAPMISVYYVILFSAVLVMETLIWQSSRTYELVFGEFVKNVIVRVGSVMIISSLITYIVELHTRVAFINFTIESCISVCGTGAIIFFFGIEKTERKILISFVKNKLSRFK